MLASVACESEAELSPLIWRNLPDEPVEGLVSVESEGAEVEGVLRCVELDLLATTGESRRGCDKCCEVSGLV